MEIRSVVRPCAIFAGSSSIKGMFKLYSIVCPVPGSFWVTVQGVFWVHSKYDDSIDQSTSSVPLLSSSGRMRYSGFQSSFSPFLY